MAEMELAGVNLPYSLDAEQSVLGAILLDGNANMPKASAKLHPEHFYVKVHTDIYTVMMQMFAASDNIEEQCFRVAGGRQKLSCKADGNRPQHLKR